MFSLLDVEFNCSPFTDMKSSDESLSNVKLVVCAPPNEQHRTSFVHPVDYVLQEGGIVYSSHIHSTCIHKSAEHQLSCLCPTCSCPTNHMTTLTDTLTHALECKEYVTVQHNFIIILCT